MTVGPSAGNTAAAIPEADEASFVHLAPAKVNLSLLVGPRREDGYHPLSTVFVPLDLADSLEFGLEAGPDAMSQGEGPRFGVTCEGVAHEDNLATRALLAIERETGWVFSGHLAVRKRIPKGAGLGGGSSDAAVALRVGAETVANCGGPALGRADLHRLARELGADVPFFLEPRPALAAGVGDMLEPLSLPPLALVLLLPRSELSTEEVYRTFDGVATREPLAAFEERRQRSERAWRTLSSGWASGGLDERTLCFEIARLLSNDLEMASVHLLPELAVFSSELDGEEVLGTLMSGSGPTVFALCESTRAARSVAGRLRSRGLAAQAVTTQGSPSP